MACGQVELLGNGSPRHSLRCIDRGSHASDPNDTDRVKLLRVGRFLIGRPITCTHSRWRVRSDHIMAHTDSEWAANQEIKRSVSGGMLVQNGGLLRFWSRRHKRVSFSSCESGLYATVSTGVETIGFQSGLRDLGNNTRVTRVCVNCINLSLCQH